MEQISKAFQNIIPATGKQEPGEKENVVMKEITALKELIVKPEQVVPPAVETSRTRSFNQVDPPAVEMSRTPVEPFTREVSNSPVDYDFERERIESSMVTNGPSPNDTENAEPSTRETSSTPVDYDFERERMESSMVSNVRAETPKIELCRTPDTDDDNVEVQHEKSVPTETPKVPTETPKVELCRSPKNNDGGVEVEHRMPAQVETANSILMQEKTPKAELCRSPMNNDENVEVEHDFFVATCAMLELDCSPTAKMVESMLHDETPRKSYLQGIPSISSLWKREPTKKERMIASPALFVENDAIEMDATVEKETEQKETSNKGAGSRIPRPSKAFELITGVLSSEKELESSDLDEIRELSEMRNPAQERILATQLRDEPVVSPKNSGIFKPFKSRIIPQNVPQDFNDVASENDGLSIKSPPFRRRKQKARVDVVTTKNAVVVGALSKEDTLKEDTLSALKIIGFVPPGGNVVRKIKHETWEDIMAKKTVEI